MQGNAPEQDLAGPVDLVAKGKHEAWKKITGASPEKAMKEDINLVDSL
jgi:acyl-CoA-binding protein